MKTHVITNTRLFKYTENFSTKNENFQIKTADIFLISVQNTDSLEAVLTSTNNLCF